MSDKEPDEADMLIKFLSEWGARNEFKFVLPQNDDANIDFININLKTQTIYADELNVTEPLTEVG